MVQQQTVCPFYLKSYPALRQFPIKASLSSTPGLCFCNYQTYILLSCQLNALNIDFFRLMTSLTNSYDGNIVYSFQALPQWMRYFHNPAGTGLTLLNSMQVSISIKFNAYEFLSLALQTFGSFAALPMTPYIADGLGRRTSIFIGALVLCVAIAIQTAANSLGMFIAARYASYFIPIIVLANNSDLFSLAVS